VMINLLGLAANLLSFFLKISKRTLKQQQYDFC